MGFFGLLLLARCDGPLLDVPALAAIEPDRDRGETPLIGGWREAWIHRGDEVDTVDLAHALVEATKAPVLVAHVLDDDFAMVFAGSPAGMRHHFFVTTATALSAFEPWDDVPEPPTTEETVAALSAWAAEAGLVVDAVALAAAIEHEYFPDGLSHLYRALGADRR